MNPDRKFVINRIPDTIRHIYKGKHSGTLVESLVKTGVPAGIILIAVVGGASILPQLLDKDQSGIYQIQIHSEYHKQIGGQDLEFDFDSVHGVIDLERSLVVADHKSSEVEFYNPGAVKISANGIPYLTQGGRLNMTIFSQEPRQWLGHSESEINPAGTYLVNWETYNDAQDRKVHEITIENLTNEKSIKFGSRKQPIGLGWAGDKVIFAQIADDKQTSQIHVLQPESESSKKIDLPYSIYSMKGSPDGTTAVIISDDGTFLTGIKMLDLESGVVYSLYKDQNLGAYTIAWSPDSSAVAISAREYNTGDLEVMILNLNKDGDYQPDLTKWVEIPDDFRIRGLPEISYQVDSETWVLDSNSIQGQSIAGESIEYLAGSIMRFDSNGNVQKHLTYKFPIE